jgi:hypothetical protein
MTFLAATLWSGCYQNHALGLTPADGGGGTGGTSGSGSDGSALGLTPADGGGGTGGGTSGSGSDGSVSADSCSTCSVACRPISTAWPALRDLQTDGESVFAMNGIYSGADLIRIAADDTVSAIAPNRPLDWGLAVGPNTLAWPEGQSPAVVFTLPNTGSGSPMARVMIDSDVNDRAVLDASNLYYVPTGTKMLTAMPLLGGTSTMIAPVTSTWLIDVDDNAVYYYDGTANVTRRQPKDGSSSTVLAAPAGPLVAHDSVNLYNLDGPALYAIPRDGSAARTLVSWPTPGRFYSAERQVATDGKQVYYIDPVCTGSINTGCAIRSVPVGGGSVSTLCTKVDAPILITANANGIYVVDGGTIMKLAAAN